MVTNARRSRPLDPWAGPGSGAGLREYRRRLLPQARGTSQPVGWARLPFPASSLTYVRPESVPVESLFHLLGADGSPDDRPQANAGIAIDCDGYERRPGAVRLCADGLLDLALDQRRLEQFPDDPRPPGRGDFDPLRDRRPFWNGPGGVLQQLLLGDCRPRLRLNVGDRQLAGVGVRTSDCRGHGDRRVRLQGVLDDLGIDVVSASDDELLLAPGQPKIAVGVAPAEIAGVEPAFAVDVEKDALVVAWVEITLEDIRPADREDADLVDVGPSVKAPVAVKHDGRHPLIGDAQADRARTTFAGRRIDRRNAGPFREAVA